MKTAFKIASLFLISIVIVSFTIQPPSGGYENYIIKLSSDWGKPCNICTGYVKLDDTYTVTLKNTSKETLDIMVCLQSTDKTWKKSMFNGVVANDSIKVCICEGTSKRLVYAKKTGDTQIVFPTIEQVNKENK